MSNQPYQLAEPVKLFSSILQVRFASVRRSLFTTEAERSKFLAQLVAGTRDILKQQQGLSEHSNYHEFCRMLGRLKTNYQLCELVSTHNLNLGVRCSNMALTI